MLAKDLENLECFPGLIAAAHKVLEGLSPQRGKARPGDILLQTVTWVPNPEVELPCSSDPIDSSLPQLGLPDRLEPKQVTRLTLPLSSKPRSRL